MHSFYSTISKLLSSASRAAALYAAIFLLFFCASSMVGEAIALCHFYTSYWLLPLFQ